MKPNSIYKIGLLIMILINGTLIYMMVRRPMMPPPGPNQGGMKELFSEKLNLDESQKESYFQLAIEHREAIRKVENEQRDLLKEYFDFLVATDVDSLSLSSKLDEIKMIEGHKIKLTYQHFQDLKALCNEDQLPQFEEIMEDVMSVLIENQKKPGGPPRD